MRLGIKALTCVLFSFLSIAPAHADYFFCHAPSIAPRGRGLIISQVFESRFNDAYFIENAFKRYLQTSYAPYGNGWLFHEDGVTCPRFEERLEADNERMLIAGQVKRPEEELFNVPFISE